MSDQPFWMCYVEGRSGPTVKHPRYDDALREAKRLTDHTGQPVYILMAQTRVRVPERHEVVDLFDSDIPF